MEIRRTFEGFETLVLDPKRKSNLTEDCCMFGVPSEVMPCVAYIIPLSEYINSTPQFCLGSSASATIPVSNGASKVGCKPNQNVTRILTVDDLDWILRHRYSLAESFITKIEDFVNEFNSVNSFGSQSEADAAFYDYLDRNPMFCGALPSLSGTLTSIVSSIGAEDLNGDKRTFVADFIENLDNKKVKIQGKFGKRLYLPPEIVMRSFDAAPGLVFAGSENLRNKLGWLVTKCLANFSDTKLYNEIFNSLYSQKAIVKASLIKAGYSEGFADAGN